MADVFFLLIIPRPPRSTLFPTRRSSDLLRARSQRGLPPRARPGGDRAPPLRGGGRPGELPLRRQDQPPEDRKSTRLNSSHGYISYAVFCLKKKTITPCLMAVNSRVSTPS